MKICVPLALLFSARLMAAGFYGISDPTMGEYEGFWTAANGAKGRVTAQIRPLSNNRYDGFLLFFRGRSPATALSLQAAELKGAEISFGAVSAAGQEGGDLLSKTDATCAIQNGKLTGKFKGDLGEGTFEAEKKERKSPTLGAKPPAGAIVLFDGKPGDAWENFTWPVQDGLAQAGKGSIKTKTKLDNFRLHLEFRTPYMPSATGQARGNSGVYIQSRYEVQVLDSFGLYPLKDDDCGGIYKRKAPPLNACLPPMEWQTYDITYLSEGPTITVVHNGTTIIQDMKLTGPLPEPSAGFLLLQDHNNPVQFRNIWAEPLGR